MSIVVPKHDLKNLKRNMNTQWQNNEAKETIIDNHILNISIIAEQFDSAIKVLFINNKRDNRLQMYPT